jgi:hypothetical protein
LHRCSDTILQSFDPVSVAKEVADDLFPVAQGIHESAPMSFCLRFAIEYSRLRMLKAIRNMRVVQQQPKNSQSSTSFLQDEISHQKSVVDRWKGRCESQLNMLAVCKSNGIFDLVPREPVPYDCPFAISTPYYNAATGSGTKYYVTPTGCLLYYQGSFYQPCRHSRDPCSSPRDGRTAAAASLLSVQDIVAPPESLRTKLQFDVRHTGSGEILGSWPVKFYDQDAAKNEVAAQVVQMLTRWRATSSSASSPEEMLAFAQNNFEEEEQKEDAEAAGTPQPANIPWRLSKEFIEHIFMQGGNHDRGPGSIGNTVPKNNDASAKNGWGTAEGFAFSASSSSSSSSSAEFCDAITDWWPDVRICVLHLCCFFFLPSFSADLGIADH